VRTDPGTSFGFGRIRVCIPTISGLRKRSILLLGLLLFTTARTLARDYGLYANVPAEVRQWFRELRSPDGSISCCDVADCLRTEAQISGNRWQARAPTVRGCLFHQVALSGIEATQLATNTVCRPGARRGMAGVLFRPGHAIVNSDRCWHSSPIRRAATARPQLGADQPSSA